MAQAAIATDLDQPLDVHLNFAAQIAFNLVILRNIITQGADFGLVRSFTRISGLTLVAARIFLDRDGPIP